MCGIIFRFSFFFSYRILIIARMHIIESVFAFIFPLHYKKKWQIYLAIHFNSFNVKNLKSIWIGFLHLQFGLVRNFVGFLPNYILLHSTYRYVSHCDFLDAENISISILNVCIHTNDAYFCNTKGNELTKIATTTITDFVCVCVCVRCQFGSNHSNLPLAILCTCYFIKTFVRLKVLTN